MLCLTLPLIPPDAVPDQAAVLGRKPLQHAVVGGSHGLHAHHQCSQALPLGQQVLGCTRHAVPLPLKDVALL